MTATRTQLPSWLKPMAATGATDRAAYLSRWLKVWVALLTVVTLVVVFYLIAITSSLASINKNLATARNAVTGAGGDVLSLPDQVEQVNASLGQIDSVLKPIAAQTDQIIGSLTSINGRLTTTDGSLKNISSVLSSVLGQAGTIRGVLVDADDPPDRLGVQNIHRRVATANQVLGGARGDTQAILDNLVRVNQSLKSICDSIAVQMLSNPSC